jgi:hypothetical protein
MNEKSDMTVFERMVERVLSYRPAKKRKKQKRKAKAAKKKI